MKARFTLHGRLQAIVSKQCSRLKWLMPVAMLLLSASAEAQNCSANAGGNFTVCGSTATLNGTASGIVSGSPTWSFVSGPVTPTISSPNSLVTGITGMTADGNYVFQLSQPCGSGTSTSNVTVTAHPRPASFTAGPDKTGICATTGTVTLDGVIPPGFTGTWSAVNIYSFESFGGTVTTNSSFSSTTSATPDFSLIKKADHDIDPAYWAILTIVSPGGVCTYKDTTVVRFCPNPNIPVADISRCSDGGSVQYIDLPSNTPDFATSTPGSSGNTANGTTVSINVTSQPGGANMVYDRLESRRLYVTGATVPGDYTFTITVSNCCGSVTSAPMTFTISGTNPGQLNFQPAGHGAPEQLVVYSFGGSAGEVHCGTAGTATPELFYFDINPADPPSTVVTAASAGVLPPGASTPTFVLNGSGTMNRSISVDPGASGWVVGTYRIDLSVGTSPCVLPQSYFIHISDNNRQPLAPQEQTVCYPGAGQISFNMAMPPVFQGAVNSSYLQDFGGYYNFSVISQPAGSSPLVFPTSDQRGITNSVIPVSNIDAAGDYVIRGSYFSGNGAGPFLEQEFACSGIATPLEFDITLHVNNFLNSNAGSDRILTCATVANLLGNSPGVGTGLWTVASAPAGSNPIFTAPTNPSTQVAGLTVPGIYTFTWSITTPNPTGSCVSSDDVNVDVNCPLPVLWKSFDISKAGSKAILRWSTATELNNKGFTVQRSNDGEAWSNLAFVASKATNGNSTQPLHYDFTDNGPLDGTVYYRLQQTDLDGKSDHSAVKHLEFGNAGRISVSPNPAKDEVIVSGTGNKATLKIVGITGVTIKTQVLTGRRTTVDIRHLPAGMYYFIIEENNQKNNFKILKK